MIFLPLVTGLYYLLPHRFRWILIFLASCYFYMALIPKYILILFFIILVDYIAAITIEQTTGWLKTFYLVFSIVSNLGLLCFFKYYNFFDANLEAVFRHLHLPYEKKVLDLILPVGLSFHTFQSMSYTIEVYRGNQRAEKHLGYFANYVLFFPQMVAGPIERYQTLGNELKKNIGPLYDNFANGFRLILFGLFVKMAVADNIAPVVNQVYENPQQFNSVSILSAILLFSFQIYADFYGYSTIACGCARLLGINIMDNFKTPYLSRSISEFWQRWHISLSTWFRDYVYIPAGGNKVNAARFIFNILLVFTISGFWHGANWTFVCWGFLHGFFYLLEKGFQRVFNFKINGSNTLINGLLTLKTFLLVSFIWVFFRAENFAKAKQIFSSLLHNFSVTETIPNYGFAWIFAVLLLFSDGILYNSRIDFRLEKQSPLVRWAVYSLLLFGLMAMSGVEQYPFIYFQF